MDGIRMGIDASRATRDYRGISIYTKKVLEAMLKIDDEEIGEIDLLHFSDVDISGLISSDKTKTVALPYSSQYKPWIKIIQEQLVYPKFQNKLGLDVLWHPHNHGQWITPIGYVATLHDVLPLARPDLSKDLGPLHYKALSQSRLQGFRNTDAIITVSEFSKQEILRHLNIKSEKVKVVYNGIDHETFHTDVSYEEKLRVKTEYGLPDRFILTVGSYAPHKNLEFMIDSYNLSGLSSQGVSLIMVGPKDNSVYTSDSDTLEEHVENLGINDYVKMLPGVPIEDLVAIMNQAEAFCMTSLYEGFGFPQLEAMACGVPTIVSNTSSLPEICGEASIYADPTDIKSFSEGMKLLVSTPELRDNLIIKGLEHVQKYNWEDTAQQTLNIIKGIANQEI